MNMIDIVKKLRHEAAHNEVAKAVFIMWGTRDRARSIVTVPTLALSMSEHKFDYPREKYQELLKFLSSLGLGSIQYDSKGRVFALRDIRIKLQSIGRAACGEGGLTSFRRRNKFQEIKKTSEVMEERRKPVVQKPEVVKTQLFLAVSVGDKTVSLPMPSDLTGEQLTILLKNLEARSA